LLGPLQRHYQDRVWQDNNTKSYTNWILSKGGLRLDSLS
jgi:hypothetical protein